MHPPRLELGRTRFTAPSTLRVYQFPHECVCGLSPPFPPATYTLDLSTVHSSTRLVAMRAGGPALLLCWFRYNGGDCKWFGLHGSRSLNFTNSHIECRPFLFVR
jgi:hypothetical protein